MLPTSNRNSLVWSLNPIFIWMRSFGIELDCSKIRSRKNHILMILFALATVIFNFVIDCIALNGRLAKFNEKRQQNVNFVRKLVIFLSLANLAVFTFFPHFAFVIIANTSWKKLFDTMQQIDCRFKCDNMVRRSRKMTKIGMVFLIVVTSLQLYLNLSSLGFTSIK